MNIFNDVSWPITEFKHHKGHMIDISKTNELIQAIQMMV